MSNEITDEGLVKRAIANAGLGRRPVLPRWAWVCCAFELDPLKAKALCVKHGFLPWTEVGTEASECEL